MMMERGSLATDGGSVGVRSGGLRTWGRQPAPGDPVGRAWSGRAWSKREHPRPVRSGRTRRWHTAAAVLAMVGAAVFAVSDRAAAQLVREDSFEEPRTRGLQRAPELDAQPPTIRGLVVGIDAYTGVTPLDGALNDARDLHGVLDRLGAEDLTLLLDREATRDRVLGAWDEMIERSEPGDLVVFTFAGHGAQEPEVVRGSEEDGQDEVLIMADFAFEGPNARERIVDNELNQRFKEALAQDIRILFINDSCHSGGTTRSLRPAADVTYRLVENYDVTDDMLMALDAGMLATGHDVETDDLEGLIFLGGGQEYEKIPEVSIRMADGSRQMRGALSYSMGRAIEGAADQDGDGILEWLELQGYVRENVKVLSDSRQQPNLLPADGRDRPVIDISAMAASVDAVPLQAAAVAPLTLRLVGGTELDVAAARRLDNVSVEVGGNGLADLIWDTGRREVVSSAGDAQALNVSALDLQGVVDKWLAIDTIRDLVQRAPMPIQVLPDNGLHRRGDPIGLAIPAPGHSYFVLFSLSGNGTLHFHYPLAEWGDPVTIDPVAPFALNFEVTPPFGSDHIVAIAGDQPLDGLIRNLEALNGQRVGLQVAEALSEALAGRAGYRVGLQGIYTAP